MKLTRIVFILSLLTSIAFSDIENGGSNQSTNTTSDVTFNSVTASGTGSRMTVDDVFVDGNDNTTAGVMRLGTTGHTNNEYFDINFESVANQVKFIFDGIDVKFDGLLYKFAGNYQGAAATQTSNDHYIHLINDTAATGTTVLSYAPGVMLEGRTWSGSASLPYYFRIDGNPGSTNPRFIVSAKYDTGGSWTSIMEIDKTGTWYTDYSRNAFSKGSSITTNLYGYNSLAATVGQNQNGFMYGGYANGWKTDATAGSMSMGYTFGEVLETGAASPKAYIDFMTTVNNSAGGTAANKVLSIGWGSDTGVTGTFLNRSGTFSDYTFGINGRTVKTPSTPVAYANDATITALKSIMRVYGNGGAVTLDTAPAIADGVSDGQTVIIQGTNDTNTVTIVDNVNVQLASGASWVGGKGDVLEVMWSSTDSDWYEISRSDN